MPRINNNDAWWHRYVAGGAGDMVAACFTQPMDLLKVRLQLSGEAQSNHVKSRAFRTTSLIFRNGGLLEFYNGLSASLLRQCVYSSFRHGSYKQLCEHFHDDRTTVCTLVLSNLSHPALAPTLVETYVCWCSIGCRWSSTGKSS
jgi:hypothetical protein